VAFPYCLECKGGRNLCGLGYCPIVQKVETLGKGTRTVTGRSLEGPSPPSVFIGRYGYPKVRIGPLVNPEREDVSGLANTSDLFGRTAEEVIAARGRLVRGATPAPVSTGKDTQPLKVVETIQELALGTGMADTEMTFSKEVRLRLRPSFDPFSAPMGPRVEVEKARVLDNVIVPRKVDQVASDTDLLATEGVSILDRGGIDVDHIVRMFSSGLTGLERRRRLVPTRWAITAVDDIIGKEHIKDVLDLPLMDGTFVHSASYLGNHFHVILTSRVWSFEMLETWLRGSVWADETRVIQDHEFHDGRKTYASHITGAYYAARREVLRHMLRMRRQAAVIVIREITSDYFAPLGVWVIGETAREALRKPPREFPSLKAAVDSVSSGTMSEWARRSVLLRTFATQRTLDDFV